jgi:5-methylcytosine-specific restriction endonuclease McrA
MKGNTMIEQIKELIDRGYGQRRISQEIGITRDKLRTILKNNGIKTINKKVDGVAKPNEFAKSFDKQYDGRFIYIDGYTNNNCVIRIKCVNCGHVLYANAGCLRKNHLLICNQCKLIDKQKRLEDKKIEQYKLYIRNSIINMKLNIKPKKTMICEYCGKEFISHREVKYCSKTCMNRRNNYNKTMGRRKKAFINGNYDKSITLSKLIKRDKVCQICGSKVDCEDKKKVNGTILVGSKYPSIDHIIPISKCGTHTWDNIQLAHVGCNVRKSDKTNVVAMVGKNQLAFDICTPMV